MDKQFKNVEDMIKGLSDDKKFSDDTIQEIREKTISKFLFSLRCEQGLTQKQMAEKIGYSQSRISRIESAYDKDLKVEDLLMYGKALKFQLEVGYRAESTKITDLIKYHAFKIKEYSDKLAELAGKDKDMVTGVLNFYGEMVFNLDKIINGSFSKLDISEILTQIEKEQVHISKPISAKNKTTSQITA